MSNLLHKKMILAALFAALTAVMSQIAVPLPFTPVPISLATLAVFLSGGLLGPKYGLISQIVYICLGLAGLPVFAQFTGGTAILFGPTGGYLIGYALAALCSGLLIRPSSMLRSALAFTTGLFFCYGVGTLWFMFTTGTGLLPSLMMCVVPFLPGDGLKITASILLVRRLAPALKLY